MGYGRKWTDKINLNKEAWIKILMAVAISVIISTVVLLTQAPSNADMAQAEDRVSTVESTASGNAADISELQNDTDTIEQQYGGVANTVSLHTGSINSLKGRMDTAEGNITAICDELATVGSPPEGYLTGTFGNYTLHAKASEAGNYTANVHLVFAPPIGVGNATTYSEAVANFTATVNWTMANVKAYVPIANYNGTTWGISQVWWNVGTFTLVANNETAVAIPFAGLNSTYMPNFAYVEVFPVLK